MEGGRDRESVHCNVTALLLLLLLLRASLGDRDRDRLAGWEQSVMCVCVSVLHDDQLGDCGDKWIVAQADHRNVHCVCVCSLSLSISLILPLQQPFGPAAALLSLLVPSLGLLPELAATLATSSIWCSI